MLVMTILSLGYWVSVLFNDVVKKGNGFVTHTNNAIKHKVFISTEKI